MDGDSGQIKKNGLCMSDYECRFDKIYVNRGAKCLTCEKEGAQRKCTHYKPGLFGICGAFGSMRKYGENT